MKPNKLVIVGSLLLLVTSCAIFNKYSINDEQYRINSKQLINKNLAILRFDKEGNGLPANIGNNISDKISEDLYISSVYNIVDRSLVNSAMRELKINSTEYLSPETIKELGKMLDAQYLILGKISNSSSYLPYEEDIKGKLALAIRIISVDSLKIAGTASVSINYEHDLKESIPIIAKSIVNKITGN